MSLITETWNRTSVPPAAIVLVAKTEGCILHPYKDGAGIPTIGWGSTFNPDGSRVTMASKPLTQAQADALRNGQLIRWVGAVAKSIPGPLTNAQAAALVSFTHNLGPDALNGSMIQKMMAGDQPDLAANQLNGWAVSAGKVVLGLLRRREFERQVWCEVDPDTAYAVAWAMSLTQLMPLYTRAFTEAAAWRAGTVSAVKAAPIAATLHAGTNLPAHPVLAKPAAQSEADALMDRFNSPSTGA